jgi:uncharacterized protein YceK
MSYLTRIFCLLALAATMSGCSTIASLAYDDQLATDQHRCNSLISWSDRQACIDRVKLTQKQADAVRK